MLKYGDLILIESDMEWDYHLLLIEIRGFRLGSPNILNRLVTLSHPKKKANWMVRKNG